MSRRLPSFFAACLVMLLLPAAGAAQTESKSDQSLDEEAAATETSTDLDRLIAILQNVGYRAVRDDSTSPPSISSKFAGLNSRVELFRCDEGTTTNCAMIRFHVGFDMPDGLDMTIINAWNVDKYFGRAYLDDQNDPHLDMVTPLIGAGDDNLEYMVEVWDVAVSGFKEHIDW